MFEKAATNFFLAPDDTSFLFVVPYLPSAPWFHFTQAYHVVHIHRKAESARMFSRPRAGTFRPAALTDAGDEGGPGRVFIQECPYDFMVLYRNKGTPIRMDYYVAARLRFGHYGSQHGPGAVPVAKDVRLVVKSLRTAMVSRNLGPFCARPHASLLFPGFTIACVMRG